MFPSSGEGETPSFFTYFVPFWLVHSCLLRSFLFLFSSFLLFLISALTPGILNEVLRFPQFIEANFMVESRSGHDHFLPIHLSFYHSTLYFFRYISPQQKEAPRQEDCQCRGTESRNTNLNRRWWDSRPSRFVVYEGDPVDAGQWDGWASDPISGPSRPPPPCTWNWTLPAPTTRRQITEKE
jgi:hypothetical protein